MPTYRGTGGPGESNTSAAAGEVAQSASEAAASATLAEQWATEDEDTVVSGGEYSAYHWAQKAQEFYGGGSIIVVSATEPTSPSLNDLWLDIS